MSNKKLDFLEYSAIGLLILSFLYFIFSLYNKMNLNKTIIKNDIIMPNTLKIKNKYEKILEKYNFELIELNTDCSIPYAIVVANEEYKNEFKLKEPYVLEDLGNEYKIFFKFHQEELCNIFVKEKEKYILNAIFFDQNDNWVVVLNNNYYNKENYKLSGNDYINEVNLNIVKLICNDKEAVLN